MPQQSAAKQSLRILHIISGLGDGGAEAVLYRLCQADRVNRHEVISLLDQGKYGQLLLEIGVDVEAMHLSARTAMSILPRLIGAIRRRNPDVVQTWLYHGDVIGGLAARLAGKPVFWGLHNTRLDPVRAKRSTIIMARIAGKLSRIVPRGIVSCSQRAADDHIADGYPAAKLHTIPNGYNLEDTRFSLDGRKRIRRELQVANQTPLIGKIARFDPQKDHRNFFEALAFLRKTQFPFRAVLAGKDISWETAELKAMIEDLDLQDHVDLLGSRRDIADIYSALDVNVLASAYGEAFPNVIAEAMACGTPVVATDVGDSSTILGPHGALIAPKDPDALASAIIETLMDLNLDDPIDEDDRGTALRQHVNDNFSSAIMLGRYLEVWRPAA